MTWSSAGALMVTTKTALFFLLAGLVVVFLGAWGMGLRGTLAARERVAPTAYETFVGAVTNFFDTLGIGSFATTTTLYTRAKTVDDRALPRHAQHRPHDPDVRRGVHLHRSVAGRPEDAGRR